jgi:hypothetical protein
MKYKLLKDTPTIKAGTIFEEIVNMSDGTRELTVAVPGEDTPQDPQFTIQDIDNFDEWFEEMEEPTDSIYWKPNNGDEYWYIDDCAGIYRDRWDDESIHFSRYSLGLIKRTKEECEKARDRKLAEVRLRRTSDFEPDFENGNGGWIVEYDYTKHRLAAWRYPFENSGEPVRYETEEDAKKSIEENEQDWLKYFGIEEK